MQLHTLFPRVYHYMLAHIAAVFIATELNNHHRYAVMYSNCITIINGVGMGERGGEGGTRGATGLPNISVGPPPPYTHNHFLLH